MHIVLLEPHFKACAMKAPVLEHQNQYFEEQQGFKMQAPILGPVVMLLEPYFRNCASKAQVLEHQNRCLEA